MGFGDGLMSAVHRKKTPVLVGIDPRSDLLPDSLQPKQPTVKAHAEAYRQFSIAIIDLLADLVPAVKFQMSFFEALGPAGMVALHESAAHAQRKGLVVIFDGKRGDIGSTAEAYAQAYLGSLNGEPIWPANALTVNPFLGRETLEPFVSASRERDAGLFVLVRTSNPGSADLQTADAEGNSVSDRIASWVEEWARSTRGTHGFGDIGAVVGATHPGEIAGYRERMPSAILLLPGYGAQGASAAEVAEAFDRRGLGGIVNSSRGIIFAYRKSSSKSADWADSVRAATEAMIQDLRDHTPAGNL